MFSTRKKDQSLPPGTCIDRYRLTRTLGGGGFSYVYLAEDVETAEQVVIKEFIPARTAQRLPDGTVAPKSGEVAARFNQGRRLFFQEASALATLRHPNIVRVITFFRANGTVYLVMEHQEGRNLQHYLTERGGRLSETFLRTVFPPLLDGLEAIHAHDLLHLDIKPGNIHIRPGGRPLLLDFGAVHGFPQSRSTQPGQVVSAGFSPIEQYDPNGYVGPWTDIYALGATMRACIEGKPPPSARDRSERDDMKRAVDAFGKGYSRSLLAAIDWAMEIDPLLRPQSAAEFREALLAEDPPPPATDDAEARAGGLGRWVGSLLGKQR